MSNVTVLEPSAFVIVYERRLFTAQHQAERPAEGTAQGWRPVVWVRSLERADKFGSREAALDFAEHYLNPGYEIRPVYPRNMADLSA